MGGFNEEKQRADWVQILEIIFFVILIMSALTYIGFCIYKKTAKMNDNVHVSDGRGDVNNSNNKWRKKKKKGHAQLAGNESGDDDEFEDVNMETELAKPTTSGYDMSPLHRESDEDRQENAIDDEDDGALMT